MKVLIIRGYDSSTNMDESIEVAGKSINITMLPIGKPVLLKKKLKSVLAKYNPADYDYIYLVSMSSCITSILDDKLLSKVCLITPFYLRTKPIFQLLKATPKDFFGCYILMFFSGKMGKFDQRIRVKLAELDNITDNNFFQQKFKNIEIIKGVCHFLGEYGVLDIVKKDIEKFILNRNLVSDHS